MLKFWRHALTLGVCTFVLVGCQTTTSTPSTTKPATEVRLTPVNPNTLPQADATQWGLALAAFQRSCSVMGNQALWQATCLRSLNVPAAAAQAFFEQAFDFYRVQDQDDTPNTGLMTGYYEPLLHGSHQQSAQYPYPIYSPPDDLIIVDLASLYPQLKGMRLRGKVVGRRLVPYDDRAGITKREQDLSRYAIAYVDDPVEALFLQIQGSGRIQFEDGQMIRVGYADQNGHPYKAVGRWLLDQKLFTPDQLSMQTIKAWAKANPMRRDELLNTNPSYVFFDVRQDDPSLGPRGAQNVPLTPQASVAVDRTIWQYGLPFLVQADQDNPALHIVEPVIAQDTGGAIRGAIRFDYFWGFGAEAGTKAGRQKSTAQAWVMIPAGQDPARYMRVKPMITSP